VSFSLISPANAAYSPQNVINSINAGDPIMTYGGQSEQSLFPGGGSAPAIGATGEQPFTPTFNIGPYETILPGATNDNFTIQTNPPDTGLSQYVPFMPGNPLYLGTNPPGSPTSLGTASGVANPTTGAPPAASSVFNYVEELAIRGGLIIVGLVLIGGGFYLAGSRARFVSGAG
jgi:hypothetical protein